MSTAVPPEAVAQRAAAMSTASFADEYLLLLAQYHGVNVDQVSPRRYRVTAAVEGGKERDEQDRWERIANDYQRFLLFFSSAPPSGPALGTRSGEAQSDAGCRRQEARELLEHVDVFTLTSAVCMQRVAFLAFLRRQQPVSTSGATEQARGQDAVVADVAEEEDLIHLASQPVVRASVTEIFKAARARLPTTNLSDSDSDDTTVVGKEPQRLSELLVPDEIDEAHLLEEERAARERQAEIAVARDRLLTQVQGLQNTFFQKYRRWVDVPMDSVMNESLQATPAQKAPFTATRSTGLSVSERVGPSSVSSSAPAPQVSTEFPSVSTAATAATQMMELLQALRAKPQSRPSFSPHGIESVAQAPLPPSVAEVPLDDHVDRMAAQTNTPEHFHSNSLHAPATSRISSSGDENAEHEGNCAEREQESAAAERRVKLPPAHVDFVGSAVTAAVPPRHAVGATSTDESTMRRGRWQIVEYDDKDDDDDDAD